MISVTNCVSPLVTTLVCKKPWSYSKHSCANDSSLGCPEGCRRCCYRCFRSYRVTDQGKVKQCRATRRLETKEYCDELTDHQGRTVFATPRSFYRRRRSAPTPRRVCHSRNSRRAARVPRAVFRNQHITGDQHLVFTACFGELDEPHPVFDRDDSDPRLTIIESKGRAHDGEHYWHTDVTYQEAPSFGSAKSKA